MKLLTIPDIKRFNLGVFNITMCEIQCTLNFDFFPSDILVCVCVYMYFCVCIYMLYIMYYIYYIYIDIYIHTSIYIYIYD